MFAVMQPVVPGAESGYYDYHWHFETKAACSGYLASGERRLSIFNRDGTVQLPIPNDKPVTVIATGQHVTFDGAFIFGEPKHLPCYCCNCLCSLNGRLIKL